MRYEMKEGETVKHLLKYCGGFTANAYTDAVRIMRSNARDYKPGRNRRALKKGIRKV